MPAASAMSAIAVWPTPFSSSTSSAASRIRFFVFSDSSRVLRAMGVVLPYECVSLSYDNILGDII